MPTLANAPTLLSGASSKGGLRFSIPRDYPPARDVELLGGPGWRRLREGSYVEPRLGGGSMGRCPAQNKLSRLFARRPAGAASS